MKWELVDLIFAISGHRGISERDVVNGYTYRQATMLVEHLIREKFAVVSEVLSSFGKGTKKPSSSPSSSAEARRLPSWYRTKPNVKTRVVDLDGPMKDLAPYMGKGKLTHRKGPTARRAPARGRKR